MEIDLFKHYYMNMKLKYSIIMESALKVDSLKEKVNIELQNSRYQITSSKENTTHFINKMGKQELTANQGHKMSMGLFEIVDLKGFREIKLTYYVNLTGSVVLTLASFLLFIPFGWLALFMTLGIITFGMLRLLLTKMAATDLLKKIIQ